MNEGTGVDVGHRMKEMSMIDIFQLKYPTKEAKEETLKNMTDVEIDDLIKASTNIYGKIFYSSFKKDKA